MTEAAARAWIAACYGEEATQRVADFLEMVVIENNQQNLIAPSTVAAIWTRHALDSAQLARFGPGGRWLDIGSGGGFPGLVVALLRDAPMLLVEPRRKRASFLKQCIDRLGLAANVEVATSKVEAVTIKTDNISARAVSGIENLLQSAAHCATVDTRWILPRGGFDANELAALDRHWRYVFHVEQSLTARESSIVILEQVRKR